MHSLFDDIEKHVVEKVVVLSDWHEVVREHQPSGRMHPPHQCLDARQFAAARKVNLGLVMKDDFLFVQRSTKFTEQRDLLVKRVITSEKLTGHYIDRIQRLNGDLNIVIREHFAAARQRARDLDKFYEDSGRPAGPLHGVPFTLKDAFRVKGAGTSYGFPGLQFLPALDDSVPAGRLLAAGGILLGQTNVPFSCFDWQSNSPIYGLTRNPIDRERTVGGSSGGAAASVAAFFSPFEAGSDAAGSVRYPAHCCGVFGLRPSHEFIPFAEAGPSLHPHLFSNLAVAAPIARSIDDLKLVLSVLSATPDTAVVKEKLRIAYTMEWSGIRPDPDTSRRIRELLDGIKNFGHDLTSIEPRLDFDRCTRIWGTILGYEYKQMIPLPFRYRPILDGLNMILQFREGPLKASFELGLFGSRRTYLRALEDAESVRLEFQNELQEFDLWLTPVAATAAIPHTKPGTPQVLDGHLLPYDAYLGNFLMPTSLFHHPVLAAPIRSSQGAFPIGAQLHGKRNQDWQLLADCQALGPLLSCFSNEPVR